MSLRAKHVVVTGGGSGAGAEIAHGFVKAGAKVTIMGRNAEKLEAQNLPYQVCDVSDPAAIFAAFDAARQEQGPISVVIANAGATESVPFSKMTPKAFNANLAVNLTGVAFSFQAALNDMKSAGWGRMIAIASTAGLKGYPYVTGYCAAKHGVVGLTKSLSVELARTGITVNAICPGFLETPMLNRSIENIMAKTGMDQETAAGKLREINPQNRFVQPREVAETALWLCSDGAVSINGHALSLSGGEV
ncbi:SDR family NAD(P)-dependent oxidoreductase [Labrenzia sp. PHM005]|uniref:SDR family NAD(P)-dependent oxidoreductase n=1 Tax=Labrenzia sp. PHM005 TaxID=2590016 RepID=UPI0011406159|nr:SDR family NAD(P)-dependent oxidoreductase [Labrenzia sp. PHM005]QDG74922.1 SDR family oxidoreductase [Labrenzia sp. PHM005]